LTSLLRHVDLITNSRNRSAVEAAVITAVNEMLGATRTELHKVFMPPGDVLVGLVAEIDSGAAAAAQIHEDDFSWPEQIGSIENSPHFQLCLGNVAPSQEQLPDGSMRIILPIENALHEPYAFLLILRPMALTVFESEIVQGFVKLLKNCMSMLDHSETDSLTGLLNRKTFDKNLIRILASIPQQDDAVPSALQMPQRCKARPATRDHWLGVMDIDRFKSINDRFGHQVGDEVLILVAKLMRDSFRVQDKLFRFGGEEFAALLRPAVFSDALATFERFRARVEDFVFPQVGRITISIGFTRIKLGDTPSVILDGADEALYWAKDHGRNQCHAYEELTAAGKLQHPPAANADAELI
jgi:diguanylate cyclase (GGDEF)-like protein